MMNKMDACKEHTKQCNIQKRVIVCPHQCMDLSLTANEGEVGDDVLLVVDQLYIQPIQSLNEDVWCVCSACVCIQKMRTI